MAFVPADFWPPGPASGGAATDQVARDAAASAQATANAAVSTGAELDALLKSDPAAPSAIRLGALNGPDMMDLISDPAVRSRILAGTSTDDLIPILRAFRTANPGVPLYFRYPGQYYLDQQAGGFALENNISIFYGWTGSVLMHPGATLVSATPFTATVADPNNFRNLFKMTGGNNNLEFAVNYRDLNVPNYDVISVSGMSVIVLEPSSADIKNIRAKVSVTNGGAGVYSHQVGNVHHVYNLDVDIDAKNSCFGLAIQNGFNITGRVNIDGCARAAFFNTYDRVGNGRVKVTYKNASHNFDNNDINVVGYPMDDIHLDIESLDATDSSPCSIRWLTDSAVRHSNTFVIFRNAFGATTGLLSFRGLTAAGVITSAGTPSLGQLFNCQTQGFDGLNVSGVFATHQVCGMTVNDIAACKATNPNDPGHTGKLLVVDPTGAVRVWSNLRTSHGLPWKGINGQHAMGKIELSARSFSGGLTTVIGVMERWGLWCWRSGAGTSAGVLKPATALETAAIGAGALGFAAAYDLTHQVTVTHPSWTYANSGPGIDIESKPFDGVRTY